VVDGVGMQGWVEVEDDWKHICVGNERLLKAHGGKIRPSRAMQSKIDEFLSHHVGDMVLYVVIEDSIKAILSLAGIITIYHSTIHNNNHTFTHIIVKLLL
jgi:anthranilate/para-aminobenzoate synthase component II